MTIRWGFAIAHARSDSDGVSTNAKKEEEATGGSSGEAGPWGFLCLSPPNAAMAAPIAQTEKML